MIVRLKFMEEVKKRGVFEFVLRSFDEGDDFWIVDAFLEFFEDRALLRALVAVEDVAFGFFEIMEAHKLFFDKVLDLFDGAYCWRVFDFSFDRFDDLV